MKKIIGLIALSIIVLLHTHIQSSGQYNFEDEYNFGDEDLIKLDDILNKSTNTEFTGDFEQFKYLTSDDAVIELIEKANNQSLINNDINEADLMWVYDKFILNEQAITEEDLPEGAELLDSLGFFTLAGIAIELKNYQLGLGFFKKATLLINEKEENLKSIMSEIENSNAKTNSEKQELIEEMQKLSKEIVKESKQKEKTQKKLDEYKANNSTKVDTSMMKKFYNWLKIT